MRIDETRFIQVKSTTDPKAAPYVYVQAVERLRALAVPSVTTKWLYVFVYGQGWRGQNLAAWPTERSALRRCLKAWVRDTDGSWWNPAPLDLEGKRDVATGDVGACDATPLFAHTIEAVE